ncbi:MAG: hypothetical protein J3K34DRAFT_429820 [Monoraphidium minutum]|nr:MAG: hypothetical protein J3K34DRAFT_429820 [Monoraphidium minutum]
MSIPQMDVDIVVARCDDGSSLPVLAAPGGKQYVIAEAGCEFEVFVETGSCFPRPPRRNMCYGAHAKIDGVDVGYWQTDVEPNQTVAFEGFCTDARDDGPSLYRRFKFSRADPSRDAGPEVTDPELIQAGRIEVVISCNAASGQGRRRRGAPGPDTATSGGAGAALGHLAEGKKFYLAPSLKTDQGSLDQWPGSWSNHTYKRVEVVASIELRYETASTLLLRKVLDATNPAHRALLAGSQARAGQPRPLQARAGAGWRRRRLCGPDQAGRVAAGGGPRGGGRRDRGVRPAGL